MPTNRLDKAVHYRSGIAIVELRGEITAFAEEALNEAFAEAATATPEVILLDFSNVDYINSTGIALIVGLLVRSRSTQKRLLACGLNDHYREIFAITRLADFMPIFADQASALADLKAGALPPTDVC